MEPATYRLLADLVVVVHLGFVAFVVAGGLLVLRWPRLAWAHLPCAVWGALIEFAGWVCPLTPLENDLRRLGGEAGYEGGFVERYLTSVLYPHGLTRTHQPCWPSTGTSTSGCGGGGRGEVRCRRRRGRSGSRR
jgi:hypothetical protein